MFHRPSEDDCLPCAPGHYMDHNNHIITDCFKCQAGKFAANPGRDRCEDCAPGSYSYEAAPACNPCEAGYKCPGGVDRTPCSAGSFSDTGASSCLMCPPGSFASGTGNTICQSCSTGMYSGRQGAVSCQMCGSGFYCPGGTGQIPCPDGMISEEGATNCQAAFEPGILEIEAGSTRGPIYVRDYTDAKIECPGGVCTLSSVTGRGQVKYMASTFFDFYFGYATTKGEIATLPNSFQ